MNRTDYTGLEIAVIGIAGKFPGANSINDFWDNLKNGVESVAFFSDRELLDAGVGENMLANPSYVRSNALLDEKEYFDPAFFGYTTDEAKTMDPQGRIFHECVWAALEDSGYNPFDCKKKIGLFAGAANNFDWQASFVITGFQSPLEGFAATQSANKDFLTTRLSYKLNLRGPSVFMSTACSTSLVAIHAACSSLLLGECHVAAAGGVALANHSIRGYLYQEGMIFSPDGHCRAFDANTQGTISGEGAGVVVLKRLKNAVNDRDNIWAVIIGSAINNDGNNKVGYTAPGVAGQVEVIRSARQMAGVKPESISYIETHGTGTVLGDPIELEALHLAFGRSKKKYCGLGSVKTNVGHLDAAAGAAGFIKAVLSIKNRQIPPNLHFMESNPGIDFKESPFYVNTGLKQWENNGVPLRAGVSSFGIGGTNVHLILEEAPRLAPSSQDREYPLLFISANTIAALERNTSNILDFLKEERTKKINLADIAFTLQVGRRVLPYRRAIVCKDIAEAVAALESAPLLAGYSFIGEKAKKSIVFMFSGQGPQYINMGLDLYRSEQFFRREMDKCFEILNGLMGCDSKEVLYPVEESSSARDKLNRMIYSGPVKFTFDYSFAKLLMKWGIEPAFVIGHSFGEYVAATLVGVFSLEDALRLTVIRGKLMQEMPPGAMLSVTTSEEELIPLSGPRFSTAAVNSPKNCILSGAVEDIDEFEEQLTAVGYDCKRLNVSVAGHSYMMEQILAEFEGEVKKVKLNKPGNKIKYISGMTGKLIKGDEITDPRYWSRHIRQTVRFSQSVNTLLDDRHAVFLEIGAGRGLISFLAQNAGKDVKPFTLNFVRHHKEEIPDHRYLMNKMAQLWLHGVAFDWRGFYENEKRVRVSLPTYAFERVKYPANVDLNRRISKVMSGPSAGKNRDISEWFYLPSWKKSAFINPNDDKKEKLCRLIFSDTVCISTRLLKKFNREHDGSTICVEMGDEYHEISNDRCVIDPGSEEDYERLFNKLSGMGRLPDLVIHLWGVSSPDKMDRELIKTIFNKEQDKGFFSILNIYKAMFKYRCLSGRRIIAITNDIHPVIGTERISPEKSLVLGLLKVISQENPSVYCSSIDISLTEKLNPRVINNLYEEIIHHTGATTVAYRNNCRWVQGFEKIRIGKSRGNIKNLRNGGVYLITGGPGNVGFILAGYLLEKFKAAVILAGRTRLRPEEEAGEKNEKAKKMVRLKELEKAGGKVVYYSGDISNARELESIIKRGEKEFGKLNGIIHAAAELWGPSFNRVHLIHKAHCEEQFKAKIFGLFALKQVLTNRKLDFCILLSSLSSMLGGYKFAVYSSVNIFMDSYADYLNLKDYKKNTNWVAINLEGIDLDPKNRPGEGRIGYKYSINREELAEIFERILSLKSLSNIPRLITSTGDLVSRTETWVNRALDSEDAARESNEKKINIDRPVLKDSYVEPATEIEKKLAEIWQDLFGISKVGINDNFFELGGDSLKAMSIIRQIHKCIDVEISIPDFFEEPTIKEIGKKIAFSYKKEFNIIRNVEKKEYYPLALAQKGLYVLQQKNPESTAFVISSKVPLSNEIKIDRLRKTIKKLIVRHDSLRASFRLVEGNPYQFIHKEVKFSMDYARADESEDLNNISRNFVKPFDLSSPPLFRVKLIMRNSGNILLVNIHHIISDGTSHEILERDLLTLYREKELTRLRLQYKDYAAWQNSEANRELLNKQEKYWLDVFSGEIPVLDLPIDYKRPVMKTYEGAALNFSLGKKETIVLKGIAKEADTTLFMAILAVFNVLFSKLSGMDDIIVGIAVEGRRHADPGDIIGLCVNLLPIRNDVNRKKTFKEFIGDVKERVLAAYENQEYPFERLLEKINIRQDNSRNPVFDIIFNLLSQYENKIKIKESAPDEEENYRHTARSSQYDISVTAVDLSTRLLFNLQYSTRLFKPGTIERFVGYFRNILSSLSVTTDLKLSDVQIIPEEKQSEFLKINPISRR